MIKLDAVDWRLLGILQGEARLSYAELGRRVGLTAPAVTERMRRLEDAGVLTGYRATIDFRKLGSPILAYLRVETDPARFKALCRQAADCPEVLECRAVTGSETFVLKVLAPTMEHLDDVLRRLSPYGQTTTSLVLSTHVDREPDASMFQ